MKEVLVSRRLRLFSVTLIVLVVICSVAVHPFGSVKQSGGGLDVEAPAMPLEVKALFGRSCKDCHSHQTVWPWYSYVAPVSWLVERDVRGGRDRLNLSNWPRYSFKQQEELLADIASVVKNHEMPLPQYSLMHRNAKLSDRDTEILYQWARLERRKVKAALSALSSPTPAGPPDREKSPIEKRPGKAAEIRLAATPRQKAGE